MIYETTPAAETISDWTYHENTITNSESNVSSRTIGCYLQCNAMPHTALKQHCTFTAVCVLIHGYQCDHQMLSTVQRIATHSSVTTLHLHCCVRSHSRVSMCPSVSSK